MRNKYYDKQAYRKLLLSIEKIDLKNKKVKYACRDTALLVVDVQERFCRPDTWNFFGSGNADTKGKSGLIQKLAPEFRKVSIPLYAIHWTKRGNEPDFYRFQPEKVDVIFRKKHNSAFEEETADLAQMLRERGIKNVLICGFNRSACVMDTAVSAVEKGFNTFVLDDLTGNNIDCYKTPNDGTNRRLRENKVQIITARNFLKHMTV